MFASYAVPAPVAASAHMFDFVESAKDEHGNMQKVSHSDGMTATVTLQSAAALHAKYADNWSSVLEMMASKEAKDFAIAVAQQRFGMVNPRPQLCDAPYAVDSEGDMIVVPRPGQKIAAYRVEIRLNAGR